MKLFISYGHDGNMEFVHRIVRDLRAAGHDPWIDSEEIHQHSDWRRALMDAAQGSDWTVGFLSAHAMREGGVARQEMAIAEDAKGGCLTTVLLEAQVGWAVPPGISRPQWVDMSDWLVWQVAGETAFDAWYGGKLGELLQRLRSGAAEAHAREMTRLTELLEPVPQNPHLDARIEGFVGREWLVAKLEAWRLGGEQRMLWLHGAPGCGKSAFAAWLAAQGLCNVVAVNLCDWRLRERREPRRVIHTLAWQVARRVSDYRPLLLQALERLARLDVQGMSDLDRLTPHSRFDALITQPLSLAFDGGQSRDRLLIVVDGLDEAVAPEEGAGNLLDSTLVDVLAQQGPKLPAWVALLVTSRPERPIARSFAELPFLRVDVEAAENRADLRIYARAWLAPRITDAAQLEALLDALDDKAAGSFIYLRKLRELHENHPELVLDVARLPAGLDAVYAQWFRRQFAGLEYRREVAPVLALIVAAEGPVPSELLRLALGWGLLQLQVVLDRLGGLFTLGNGGWAAFHQSLQEWLEDPNRSGGEFCLDTAASRAVLGRVLWQELAAGAPVSRFSEVELPALLPRLDAGQLREWCYDPSTMDVLNGLSAQIGALRNARAWERMLAWCQLIPLIADAIGPGFDMLIGDLLDQQGDAELLVGRSRLALASFRRSLEAGQLLAARYPRSTRWQRALSVSHCKIGDVLQTQGDLDGALAEYHSGMNIALRLAESSPDNGFLQRDLSFFHGRLGDVRRTLGDVKGAISEYRARLTITKNLVTSDPSNVVWQQDLAASYKQIGDALRIQGDLDGALGSYRAGRAIIARLTPAPVTKAIQSSMLTGDQ